MINSYETVHEIIPTRWGDHVELRLSYRRGVGYEFRAMPFFDKPLSREYHFSAMNKTVRILFDCERQSKKRYEEAKQTAFDYIYGDAGRAALNETSGIVLLGKVSEREWDCYA